MAVKYQCYFISWILEIGIINLYIKIKCYICENVKYKTVMSVILKVDEKVKLVIEMLSEDYSEDDFYEKFVDMYPKDYEKCMKRFLAEERKTKPGKAHPMQHPKKHIINALKSYLSRNKN